MSKFYLIEPEICGRVDSTSVSDGRQLIALCYEFDAWLGDDLIGDFQVFMCTEHLASQLKQIEPPITGVSFDKCTSSKSDEYSYYEIQNRSGRPRELPVFTWLRVNGQAGTDDMGELDKETGLVVSERVLEVIKSCRLDQAEIREYMGD